MDKSSNIVYNKIQKIPWRFVHMKFRLALLICILALMLTACGRWIVEDVHVQVGDPVVRTTPVSQP